MKKKIISALVLIGLLVTPMAAYADAAVGDQIVTIGTNLTQQQRQEVLSYFGAKDNAQIIDVDISEERQYLSGKVPDAQIGNSTNSCAMITYTTKGSGVNVTTHNINYVTPDAYKSAILTAGINDADVQITAPIEVSGTGALTGIMKAYEVSTGEAISEDVKQAATQELVTNSELGSEIGDDQANDLINTIKQEIAENAPQNEAEAQSLLDRVLSELGITLTDEQYQQLLDLIQQFADLNINWDSVADSVSGLIGQASDYLQTDEGQGFLAKLQELVNSFFDWIRGIFGGGSDSADATETTETTETTDPNDTAGNNVMNDETTDPNDTAGNNVMNDNAGYKQDPNDTAGNNVMNDTQDPNATSGNNVMNGSNAAAQDPNNTAGNNVMNDNTGYVDPNDTAGNNVMNG